MLDMDTWQDEMFDNMAGHTPFLGVPYLSSDPDSKYTTTPDDIGIVVEKESSFSRNLSKLSAKPQVNWMLAPNPNKVNWLQASETRPKIANE